jgi:hypothetical protein
MDQNIPAVPILLELCRSDMKTDNTGRYDVYVELNGKLVIGTPVGPLDVNVMKPLTDTVTEVVMLPNTRMGNGMVRACTLSSPAARIAVGLVKVGLLTGRDASSVKVAS